MPSPLVDSGSRALRSLVAVLALAAALVCAEAVSSRGGASAAPPDIVSGHPRLFLRADDVARLRERCRSQPELRDAYRLVRDFAYGDSMQSNLWVAPDELSAILVAYLVEDRDPVLLARARRYVEAFSRTEGDSWTQPRMLKALAHAYDWLHDELSAEERVRIAERLGELAARMRRRYRHSDYNNHVYLERGPLLYAGIALWGDGVADELARSAVLEAEELLKEHFLPTIDQLGADGAGGWHESMSYWSFFAYELAHQFEAWRVATGEDLFRVSRGLRGAPLWLLHSTRPHDGSMAPVGDIDTPVRWGGQELAYLPLLAARYRDGVAQLAASRVAPRYPGQAWPLLLWHESAVAPVELESLPTAKLFPGVGWAAMRSSWQRGAVWALFVCGDHYAGHQHSDQNSFVISSRGDLAIDAGEYGAKATRFHNTVLIGEGQRIHGNDGRQLFGPTVAGSRFDTGDILAFEKHPSFTYVVGDASKAYGAFRDGERVEPAPRFVRRFLFIEPSTFVIDDHVSSDPTSPPRWLLHSNEAPEIMGRKVRIADGDGVLVSETLLPMDARLESHRDVGGRRAREHHRLEVLPAESATGVGRDVRFLHVLSVLHRDAEGAVPATATLEDGAGDVRLRVAAGERVVRLELPDPRVGDGGVEILTAAGEVLVPRRPLAAGVLPHDSAGLELLERWDSAYREGRRPQWDTGRPSSSLRGAVERGELRPCRAVVLGCGTGTNAIYLAQRGFEVTAIDIAPTALSRARAKAVDAGVRVRWVLADVLAPPSSEPFDLVFDRGCYHGVRRTAAAAYVETLRRLTREGGRVLILAGNAEEPPPRSGPPRVTESELRADFSEAFEIESLERTRFDSADPRQEGPWAWKVLLRRRGDAAR